MATDDPVLEERLKEGQAYFERPWRFDFFQAVKLIEAWVRQNRRLFDEPEPEPIGSTPDPDLEAVQFRATTSFGFRPSDIKDIQLSAKDADLPLVEVDFMSLTGARGPLPHFYTELIRDRRRLGDTAMRDFYDIFNHRAISMLYRVRQKNRPTLQTGPPQAHPFAQYLLSLCGLRGRGVEVHFSGLEPQLAEGDAFDDIWRLGLEAGVTPRNLIYYAGLFWHRERSMHGLEQLLTHFYGFPVIGRQMQGRWITLAPEARSALSAESHHNRLGVSAVAGARIWDPQSGFELQLGPLGWKDFIGFLPAGDCFGGFSRLVKLYVRGAFDFNTRLKVKAEEIHPNQPGLSTRETGVLRLGWTSWLMTRPMPAGVIEVRTSGKLIDPPEPVEPEPEDGESDTPLLDAILG